MSSVPGSDEGLCLIHREVQSTLTETQKVHENSAVTARGGATSIQDVRQGQFWVYHRGRSARHPDRDLQGTRAEVHADQG